MTSTRRSRRRSDDDLLRGSYAGRREPLWSVRGIGLVVLAFAVIFAVFFVGEYAQRYLRYRAERAGDPALSVTPLDPLREIGLNTLYELPMGARDERLLASGLPVYDLRIAPKHVKTLQATAELVTARKTSIGVVRDYLPAEFSVDGVWQRVKIKLRGLYAYHYLKKRPSLRVKFPSDRLFHGKRQINLLEPYDKLLTVDATSSWELAQHGIMAADSQFVVVRVNGELQGLFQEIEHFGRGLTDRSGRTEGYIFSGLAELYGKPGTAFEKAERAAALVRACYPDPGVTFPAHCRDWKFFDTYFDTDLWGWATALTTLLHSRHAWAPDNLRLYWDPSRGRFEPLPWDYHFFAIDPLASPDGEPDLGGYLAEAMLSVPEFRRVRDEHLWTLLTTRIEAMALHSQEMFDAMRDALAADRRHPTLAPDLRAQAAYVDGLRQNADRLRELFERTDLSARVWHDGPERLAVELENRGKAAVTISELQLEPGGIRAEEAHVDGIWRGEPGRVRLSLPVPRGALLVGLTGHNQVTGAALAADDLRVTLLEEPPPAADTAEQETAQAFELDVSGVVVEAQRVVFGPGRVDVDRLLEIPRPYRVVLSPGTELRFSPAAGLLIYGDLTGLGTEARPIRLSGRAPGDAWAGLFVQGTRTRPSAVRLSHVTLVGGVGGENERTRFTASFAVHDGIVDVRTSEFRDSTADDGINLKHARVHLEANRFVRASDDAVDCDFCRGRLVGNHVVDAGGDAVDFSGSDVTVENTRVENCGDKALSIGERTRALVTDLDARGCVTGVAVKDLSDATLRDVRLADLEIGVSLYAKKQTFGPSRASVESVSMLRVATPYLREAGCRLDLIPSAPRSRQSHHRPAATQTSDVAAAASTAP